MSGLFLSHSDADKAEALRLRERLRAWGYEATFLAFDPDGGVPAGENWERALYGQLRACDAVVVLCSESSMASRWCFAEVALARSMGKLLFPLKIGPCEVEGPITEHQIVDLTSGGDRVLDHLRKRLRDKGLDPSDSFGWNPSRPPYPGLPAHDAEDAGVFFGRKHEWRQVLELLRLMGDRTVPASMAVVLGASGSGKSSLIRAGVLPRLKKDRRRWLVPRPIRPGSDPIGQLLESLRPGLRRIEESRGAGEADELRRRLAPGGRWGSGFDLAGFADRFVRAVDRPDATLLVAIDQFEELLLGEKPRSVSRFLAGLRAAMAPDSGRRVVALATLRSDALGRFQQCPELSGLDYRTLAIGPMTRSGLEDAILDPARRAGIDFQPELAGRMIDDMAGPDALPQLALALREMYDRAEDRKFTLGLYQQVGGIGGVVRTVVRSVERRCRAALDDPATSADVRRAFLRLVEVGERDGYVRRAVPWDEIPPRARPVLDQFVERRLLTSRAGDAGPVVEVAHESLFRVWDRLGGWLDEDRTFLLGRRRLSAEASAWEEAGRPEALLLRDGRLAEGLRWLEERPEDLDPGLAEYLGRGRALRDREASRRRRRNAALIALTAASTALAGLALSLRDAARRSAEAERSQRLAAQSAEALESAPQRALLLAVEACNQAGEGPARPRAEQALRDALARVGGQALVDHGGPVRALAVAAGTGLLATAGVGGEVALWDVSGRPARRATLRCFDDASRSVLALAYDDRGARLFAAGDGGMVRGWDVSDPDRPATIDPPAGLGGPGRAVLALAFARDGRLVAAGLDGVARVSAGAGSAPLELGNRRGRDGGPEVDLPIRALAVGPGGLLAAGGDEGSVRVWDLARPGEAPRILDAPATVLGLAFDPDGRRLFAASVDGSVRAIDLGPASGPAGPGPGSGLARPGPAWRELGRHDRAARALVVGPGGLLVSVGSDHLVRVSDPDDKAKGPPASLPGHEQAVHAVAVLPDGRVVTGGDDRLVRRWDLDSPQAQPARLRVPRQVFGPIAAGPGGRVVVAGADAGLWSARIGSREPAARLEVGRIGRVVGLAFSPDGHLAVAGSAGLAVLTPDGTPVRLPEATPRAELVAFAGDRRLVAVERSGKVVALDTGAPGRPARVLRAEVGLAPAALLVGGDGSRIVVGDENGLRFADLKPEDWGDGPEPAWDRTTQQDSDRTLGASCLVALPDAGLAVGWTDRSIRTWGPEPRQSPTIYRVEDDDILGLGLAGDGRLLAFARNTYHPNLIFRDRPRERPVLLPMPSGVVSAAVTPDGRHLVAALTGQQVVAWDLDLGDLVGRARDAAGRNLREDEWGAAFGDRPPAPTFADRVAPR